MEPLLELVEQVVRHLSNHSESHLRWRIPGRTRDADQALRFGDDSVLIMIHPKHTPDEKLKIMLRECAYIRHYYEYEPPRWEVIAQWQADEWLEWAENNAWKYKRSDNTLMEAELWSLLEW